MGAQLAAPVRVKAALEERPEDGRLDLGPIDPGHLSEHAQRDRDPGERVGGLLGQPAR